MRITEARILMPLTDNEGKSLSHVHDAMRADLLASFGGFTESDTRGWWRDTSTGTDYKEPSIAFDIAAQWDSEKSERLMELAAWYCRAAKQLCVYVRNGKGAVSYVAPKAARELAKSA
jgi:hypothetical protein